MRTSRTIALLALALPLVAAAGIESIAPRDSVDGLKTALNQGATRAVTQLGVKDGFLRNPKVKIPLPPTLKKAEKALRMAGMGDDAATKYFRKVSYAKLEQKFLPVVKKTTDQAQLAAQYNQLAGQAARLGLVSSRDANVEGYVTRKALDGLFFMIAEEERAIRRDPLGQSSRILLSVFGALGQ